MEKIVIFDLDGTISNMKNRLHLRGADQGDNNSWIKFNEAAYYDRPIKNTIDKLIQYYLSGYKVAILTGRPEEYQIMTIQWLNHYRVPFNYLWMRPTDDHRLNHLYKKEKLEAIMSVYEILAYFDDEIECVDVAYDLGLVAFQVINNGLMIREVT